MLGVTLPRMAKKLLCTRCYSTDAPKTHTKGSFLIELFLWLLFIVPGLLYSLWRLSTRSKVCAHCGSSELVAMDSPRAQQILKR